jgi:SAM domain (Sterile alpha motif)
MDVGEWLRSLDLERYEAAFRDNEIDFRDLPELTEGDFERLGIPLGPRRRLLKALRELASATPAAQQIRPTDDLQSGDAAECRQLTVMFCDLVGSTALSAKCTLRIYARSSAPIKQRPPR